MKNTKEYQRFAAKIYAEHLEEASFLYQQRLAWVDATELSWRNLDCFEAGWEAHIYGLEFGGEVALSVCRKQATAGDTGELFAATCMFCRQNRRDLLGEVLENLNWGDVDSVRSVTDALCLECPAAWTDGLIGLLLSGDPDQISMACRIIAFRRLPIVEQLPVLLSHENDAVQEAAMWSLAQCGKRDTLTAVDCPVVLQALCGDAIAVTADSQETVFALGLLGRGASVPALLVALEDDALAEPAALALNLITGADLREQVFIPEDIQEEDLFPDEIKAFRDGTLYPEGEWPGEAVDRVSQDPVLWRAWWDMHQERFNDGERYRAGQPFGKEVLLELLKAEETPNQVRQWCGYELALQFDVEVPFDTMMRVVDQKKALSEMG